MHDADKILDQVLGQTASVVWSTNLALRVVGVRGESSRLPGVDVREMVRRMSGAHESALRGMSTDLDYETGDQLFEVHIAPAYDQAGFIAGCVGIAHDATARRRAERALAWHTTHDALTDLPNRTQFLEVLETAIRDARRRSGTVALLLIDVDAMHAINDAAGQAAGDAVLRAVARRIADAATGGYAYLARLCGDEFGLIVEGAPEPVAAAIVEAMSRPFTVGNLETLLGASIGVAEVPPHGESGDHLVRAADAALHRARELGGNQYQSASPDLTVAAAERLGISRRLREAITRGELSLAFQPQVRLRDRALLGVEALLRWERDGEVCTAASFIRSIEESPIIIDVGEWVLKEACRQLRAWKDAGIAPPRLAINVGARHFQHATFLPTVRRCMERYGIEGSSLEIEITETTAMHNGEASAQLIDELRALGIEITIDDFGTGYSSLAYLKRFAITGVKIDQSFVHDLPSRSASAIVNAILATANALGLRVVAEGVEDPEQAGFLESAGCLEGQGYWFARPMSADALGEYLARVTAEREG